MSTIGVCEYFINCTNEAEGYIENVVMGLVPSCQRCADVVGLPLVGRPVNDTMNPGLLDNTVAEVVDAYDEQVALLAPAEALEVTEAVLADITARRDALKAETP